MSEETYYPETEEERRRRRLADRLAAQRVFPESGLPEQERRREPLREGRLGD